MIRAPPRSHRPAPPFPTTTLFRSDPVPGVHALVAELDERGVPLFAITNFSADLWAPFRRREDAFFRQFRDIVVSGEEKLLKPDSALYYRAPDRFRLKPADALLIADRLINDDGARAVGMQAHLFTDAASLSARSNTERLHKPSHRHSHPFA